MCHHLLGKFLNLVGCSIGRNPIEELVVVAGCPLSVAQLETIKLTAIGFGSGETKGS
jgi:hypothetical protein